MEYKEAMLHELINEYHSSKEYDDQYIDEKKISIIMEQLFNVLIYLEK